MNVIIILDPIFIWKLFVKTHRELRALKVRSLTMVHRLHLRVYCA